MRFVRPKNSNFEAQDIGLAGMPEGERAAARLIPVRNSLSVGAHVAIHARTFDSAGLWSIKKHAVGAHIATLTRTLQTR